MRDDLLARINTIREATDAALAEAKKHDVLPINDGAECSYRRGYHQGYQAAMDHARKFTPAQIAKHSGEIMDWRFRKIEGHLPPEIKP